MDSLERLTTTRGFSINWTKCGGSVSEYSRPVGAYVASLAMSACPAREPVATTLSRFTPTFRCEPGASVSTVSRQSYGTRLPTESRKPKETGLVSMASRSEEHTSELQSRLHLVCRLLLEK